jgi:PTH1 family peptidyl-tRNA hydrolase
MVDLSQEPGLDPLLIIGLGNPGEKYAETRHNAGFWFLDQLVRQSGSSLKLQKKLHAETGKASLEGRECILARPTTFMNHSGMAVQAIAAYYRVEPENMLIAYDELDLAPGTARFKLGGGHGGHNGMRDVLQCASSADFYRLRIGIGHPGLKEAVTPWVLSRASREQTELIRGAIGRALEAMPLFVRGEVAEAMKCLHTRAGADSDSAGPDGSAL